MNLIKLATAGVMMATVTMAATQAKAALEIDYSLDGGATFNVGFSVASGGTAGALGVINAGNFSINTFSATSNSPGTPSSAKLLSAALDIVNTSGSTQTLVLKIGDTGFTSPGAPPAVTLSSHIGGSVITGSAASLLNFTSYVDPTGANRQNYIGAGTVSTATGAPSITVSNSSFKDDETKVLTTLSTPYSITQLLTLTLGAGGEINFSDNTTISPVPEPASLGLLGVSLVGLGLIRRRRAA